MTIIVPGGGGGGVIAGLPPALPAAQPIQGCAYDPTTSAFSAHLPLPQFTNENSFITLTDYGYLSGNDRYLYVKNGITQWNYTGSDIQSAIGQVVQFYLAEYYDSVENALFLLLRDAAGGTNHLCKIDVVTGTISYIGTDTDANYGNAAGGGMYLEYLKRDTEGAGDFTLYRSGAGGVVREILIDSSTGLVNSSTVFTLTDSNDGLLSDDLIYITQDKKIALTGRTDGNEFNIGGLIRYDSFGAFSWSEHTQIVGTQMKPIKTGNNVCILTRPNSSNRGSSVISGQRLFIQSEFDAWLNDMADWLNIGTPPP
jgi:hypothetical protein